MHVFRPLFSGYMDQSFHDQEKKMITGQGFTYHSLNLPESSEKVVLLSNSNLDYKSLSNSLISRIELVIHANSGFDNISTSDLKQLGKPVIIGNEIRKLAVSEFILHCLLRESSNPPFQKAWDKKRSWQRKLINELNIQILGGGHIGQTILTVLETLACKPLLYDPFLDENQLDLKQADVIICTQSLNSTSYHFLNDERFSSLKKDCLIINGARGELIEEKALLEFLKSNSEARCYLDVYNTEPYNGELFQLDNCFCSSHVAGVWSGLNSKVLDFESQVLNDYTSLDEKDFLRRYEKCNLQNRIREKDII